MSLTSQDDSLRGPGQAGVELAPAMVEAGADALHDLLWRLYPNEPELGVYSRRRLAVAVYRAMESARDSFAEG